MRYTQQQINELKQSLQNKTTDELLELIEQMPVAKFGYREFDSLQHATSATVSNNYPNDMLVIEIEAEGDDHDDVTLQYASVYDGDTPQFVG